MMNRTTGMLQLFLSWALGGVLAAQVPPGWVQIDDMILPESALYGDGAYTPNSWPVGGVPYAFHVNVTTANRNRTLAAMAEIEAVCGVDFYPRTNQPDYVLIQSDTVNSSPVGVIGGAQILRMVSWSEKFVIVHELMHALGFIHEQSRPDRNTYVTVNQTNVSTTACTGSNCSTGVNSCTCNFDIVTNATTTGPYDFNSIMHYGATDFSTNGSNTITCKPAYSSFQSALGNRTFMSLLDAAGLQLRYGSAVPPTATSITPTSTNAGGPSVYVVVTGTRFCGGSINSNGVPGTTIRINGTPISTDFISPTQVGAWIPASYFSTPGTRLITVQNPSPGGGVGSGTLAFNVVCPPSGQLALAANTPVSVTAPCQGYSIPSPPSQSWHVIGVSSPSDWDISSGSWSSTLGGDSCDFVAGDGNTSPGQQVSPTAGSIYRYSGQSNATIEYTTSSGAITYGTPTIAGMPAGSIIRAFTLPGGNNSNLRIQVAGPAGLRWWLLNSTATFSWRTPFDNIAAGLVGGPEVVVNTPWLGSMLLVIARSGGPAPAYEPFTISACNSGQNINLIAGPGYTASVPCTSFSLSPYGSRWNCVGVTSPSDWDINLGTAASQFGGSTADYVVANGRLGPVQPTNGIAARYSGTSAGSLHFPAHAALPTFPGGTTTSSTSLFSVFEFEVTTPGIYDLSVTGGPGYTCDLHLPGSNSAWRPRNSASYSWPADGTPLVGVSLSPGWHFIVASRPGGSGPGVTLQFGSAVSSLVPPTLTSISPQQALAGSGTFSMSLGGSGFTGASVATWNGQTLPTSFISPTQLTATVDASLVANVGTLLVRVQNPGPSGPLMSAPQTFQVGNPIPVITTLTPDSAVAGEPSTGLTIMGTGFAPNAEIRWNGQPLPSVWVSSTEMTATISYTLLTYSYAPAVTVFNPAPLGGESTIQYFTVYGPLLASCTPASIPVQAPGNGPITLTIDGADFLPGSEVWADGVLLATFYVSDTQLTALLDPIVVPQMLSPGGICLNVANTAEAISGSLAIPVGNGLNEGVIRHQPLAPQPGEAYVGVCELGYPGQPVTIVADVSDPAPIPAWPNPTANLVLGVNLFSPSTIVLRDGLGAFGAPDGTAIDVAGYLFLTGLTQPNPPLGIAIPVQAGFANPASPLGVTLSWTKRVLW